jgi:hypothetical protein
VVLLLMSCVCGCVFFFSFLFFLLSFSSLLLSASFCCFLLSCFIMKHDSFVFCSQMEMSVSECSVVLLFFFLFFRPLLVHLLHSLVFCHENMRTSSFGRLEKCVNTCCVVLLFFFFFFFFYPLIFQAFSQCF